MRTTLDLEAGALEAARQLAAHRGQSLGKVVSERVLKGLRSDLPTARRGGFSVFAAGAAITPAQALQALAAMTALPAVDYWSEAPPALQMATLNSPALVGHRQVPDAYLLGLAAHQGQCLATLGKGLETYAPALGLSAHAELVGAAPSTHESGKGYGSAPTAKRARR